MNSHLESGAGGKEAGHGASGYRVELCDPAPLRAHPLHRCLPGPDVASAEWHAFVDGVSAAGPSGLAAPPAGRAVLSFVSERGMAPVPYQPTAPAIGGPGIPHPELVSLYQVVQPPAALGTVSIYEILVLAARRSSLTTGLKCWLRVDDAELFYELGEQRQWAVAGVVNATYSVPVQKGTTQRARSGGVATLTVPSHGYASGLWVDVNGLGGADYNAAGVMITVVDASHISYACAGDDETLTADTDGLVDPQADDDSESLQVAVDEFAVEGDIDRIADTQTADAINDNAVLVWVSSASDPTVFEIMTLRAIRLEDGVYKLKVRRGRYNTTWRTFGAGAKVWIVLRTDLVAYRHDYFAEYALNGSVADFRLQAFTPNEEADLTDSDLCPDVTYTFTDVFAPSVSWFNLMEMAPGDSGFTLITDWSGFARQTVFEFSWQITAPAGLVRADVVAESGSRRINLWGSEYVGDAAALGSTEFTLLSVGVWRIFCVVHDRAGRIKRIELKPPGESEPVQLVMMVPEGTCEMPVLFIDRIYWSSGGISQGLAVPFYLPTAGSDMHWQVVGLGYPPGATYHLAFGENYPLVLGNTPGGFTRGMVSLYIYASAAGLDDSPVARYDFMIPSRGAFP